MPTASFTTRIDQKLKSRLEKIALYEERSASYMANKAIEVFVDEREQTHELVKTGLGLVDKGISLSEGSVKSWLRSSADTPFPEPDTSE